jgi:PAS domain S-box-containing protein
VCQTGDPIRVLHVDDEPDFAATAAELLEREDDRLDVRTATGPTEGLSRLDSGEFDCVVSDYEMPECDGIGFLRAVRERDPDLPFVLFTGRGSEAVASDAVSAGVTDYLQKGAGTSQYTVLANRISNAVAAHRSAVAAEQRRDRLEQILKTVPSCVVQLDADGRFRFANRRAEEVLGLGESALTERRFDDPGWEIRDLDGEPIPTERLPFRRVRDAGEALYGVRHTIRWPDGTEKVLEVNGAPLSDEDGSIRGVVFSLTDVTERRRNGY